MKVIKDFMVEQLEREEVMVEPLESEEVTVKPIEPEEVTVKPIEPEEVVVKVKPIEAVLVKLLGHGSYGSVYLYHCRRNHFYWAIKTTNKEESSRDALEDEFEILLELRGCPGIVQLLDGHIVERNRPDGSSVYMISMEYASGGSLTDYMRNRKHPLSDSTIRDFTRMILRGLVSIHSKGYVHCDLKPDNILVFPSKHLNSWDRSYELKIADFGLSMEAGGFAYCWEVDHPFLGTPRYMSPDSVIDGNVEKALDLWSLGCIVLEMYTGKGPWSGVSRKDLQGLLAKEQAPEVPDTLPCDARQFLDKCLAIKPMDRGSASELLLHPFLIRDDKKIRERSRVSLSTIESIRESLERFELATKKNKFPLVSIRNSGRCSNAVSTSDGNRKISQR